MPDAPTYFKLVIRNVADTADLLVLTSVPGGTNPYILKPFKGDGRSFDPLTGEVTSGSYNVEAIDALTAPNTRVVTANLADAGARQQLLSRKAFGYTSVDGAVWDPQFAGYVNAVRMVTPLVFDFSIGETRRISTNHEVFKSIVLTRDAEGRPKTFSQFDKVTCVVGGPIRGGWLSARDHGGWRFRVSRVSSSPKYVELELRSGFDPQRPELGKMSWTSANIENILWERVRAFWRESPRWKAAGIVGHFPHMLYRVQTPAGAHVGNFTPLSVVPPKSGGGTYRNFIINSRIYMDWTGDLPAAGSLYDVYMFPTEISKENPLHILEHPVDLRQKLWDEANIAYDASVLAGVRAAIGDELILALRLEESPGKLKDFETVLNGLFGMATRSDGQGSEVLFNHRIKLAAAPATTLTVNDLRSWSGTAFEIDESTVCNKVTIRQKRLILRTKDDEPTVDGFIAVNESVEVENDESDAVTYGENEQVYDLPGQILNAKAQQDFDLEKYTLGVAREIFDRYGRGAIGGETYWLPNVTAQPGEEVQINIPQLPNAVVGAVPVSQRGGARIVQVVARTETPSGPELRILDSGTTAQPGTLPTISVLPNPADPYHFSDLAVTNAKALKAAGFKVRVEIGVGAGAPAAGSLLTVLDVPNLPGSAAELTVAEAAALTVAEAAALSGSAVGVTIPAHDAGSKVWARARSERVGYRPSAFTAFASAQLTVLDAVTSLAVSAEDPDDISKRMLTWDLGANAADFPIEVLIRLTSETSASDRVVGIMPPRSTRCELLDLEVGERTVTVRHREWPPLNGVSANATVEVDTAGTPVVLAAPTNPVGIAASGHQSGLPSGTYGIAVNANTWPSALEIAVAVGAGDFETVATVPALQGKPTVWTEIAANDGEPRHVKARQVKQGYSPSPYCDVVSVTPWSFHLPWPHIFDRSGGRVLIDGDSQELTAQARLAEGVKQRVAGTQRAIAKGYQSGFVADDSPVVFNPAYQNTPQVLMRGGEDGGAGTYPLYQAEDLGPGGFTCRAKIRTKGAITARSDEFTAPLAVTTSGATVGPATLGDAPAWDNKYKVRFEVEVSCTVLPFPGGNGAVGVLVAIESNDGVTGWIERDSREYWCDQTGPGTNTETYPGQEVEITVSGLDNTDQVRLKIKSITYLGSASLSSPVRLEGYDNSGAEGHGVTYNTDPGGSSVTKTPDADDFIFWEAFEVAQ
ncbi:MAG TPA: hypothetical protein VNO75_12365 [Gemmatimonadaceae bacterium]|nr:hypothetical protein [Gemmatimonadaceae bacterium]